MNKILFSGSFFFNKSKSFRCILYRLSLLSNLISDFGRKSSNVIHIKYIITIKIRKETGLDSIPVKFDRKVGEGYLKWKPEHGGQPQYRQTDTIQVNFGDSDIPYSAFPLLRTY